MHTALDRFTLYKIQIIGNKTVSYLCRLVINNTVNNIIMTLEMYVRNCTHTSVASVHLQYRYNFFLLDQVLIDYQTVNSRFMCE